MWRDRKAAPISPSCLLTCAPTSGHGHPFSGRFPVRSPPRLLLGGRVSREPSPGVGVGRGYGARPPHGHAMHTGQCRAGLPRQSRRPLPGPLTSVNQTVLWAGVLGPDSLAGTWCHVPGSLLAAVSLCHLSRENLLQKGLPSSRLHSLTVGHGAGGPRASERSRTRKLIHSLSSRGRAACRLGRNHQVLWSLGTAKVCADVGVRCRGQRTTCTQVPELPPTPRGQGYTAGGVPWGIPRPN